MFHCILLFCFGPLPFFFPFLSHAHFSVHLQQHGEGERAAGCPGREGPQRVQAEDGHWTGAEAAGG